MSRYVPDRNVAPVLSAAQEWIQACLVEERSLFGNEPLWVRATTDEVRRAFTDHPDDGDAPFYDKLEKQMKDASPEAKCLMAELVWVLMLFQSNIGPGKKREGVRRIWEWSGKKLDESNPLLRDGCLIGIGSPGIAYNTGRWRELNYVIGLATDLQARSLAERADIFLDRERFESWLATAPQDGYRQFRHIFRYLAFPDQNERITQNRDRRLILKSMTDLDPSQIDAMSDKQQDDALLALRERLAEELGTSELDFYSEPLVHRWRDAGQSLSPAGSSNFERGYAELRGKFLSKYPGFRSFATDTRYRGEERAFKDELLELFDQTVATPLAESDWPGAGEAAVKLLTAPLRSEGNRPQNIVGWRYIDVLGSLDPAKRSLLGRHLGQLLDEDQPIAARVDRFVADLKTLSGANPVAAAAQRSIASFYLTLSDPHRHLFLKTTEMEQAFRMLDPQFAWNSSGLTGADVVRCEALAAKVYGRLVAESWAPKDFMDVQGFFWTAIAGDAAVAEPAALFSQDDKDGSLAMTPGPAPSIRRHPNQILFGPPGTGKTFATITKAIEILDPAFAAAHVNPAHRHVLKKRFDELLADHRIRFVTFHQSFSYEDFVEGLRADTDESGNLVYRVESGVFKELCIAASGSTKIATSVGIEEGARIWKISIDGTHESPTRDYCFAHGEARIGWGEAGDLRNSRLLENSKYLEWGTHDRHTMQSFANGLQSGDVLLCIKSATQVLAVGIVQGDYRYESVLPPGIRSTYNNVRPVKWLRTDLALDVRELNGGRAFVQKTLYELDRFSAAELAQALASAGVSIAGAPMPTSSIPPDYVLIIDEINRGNISRIFGELITLIEPSKRAGAEEQLEVVLPYSKKPFSVPANVHLIGTMNTADRSLTGLDVALRRRFEFVEMPARPDLLAEINVGGVNIGKMLATMNQRIEVLLDRDHHLGHAYFMQLADGDPLEKLADIFRMQILPLLQEYFFEDWERIHWILNDHRKPAGCRLVVQSERAAGDLFGNGTEIPADTKCWRVDPKAFGRVESYAGITGS